MGNVISNLKARFGVDTSDFKKGLKDGQKATEDFKSAAGNILDDFASMFGVNMGAVNDAIGTANKSLNFMGQSFKAATEGANKFAVGLKVLRTVAISTGLGAIVVALGSIIAYFSKTGEGADKFAKILAQVKSVVNDVIDRLAIFGKGLWELMSGKIRDGWETMRSAFRGIGDEIREDWKAAGDLADREDALDDKEIALINTLEERRAKAAELRLAAKEELDDHKKRLEMLQQAENLYKSVYGDQIAIEKERLAIMKEKLAIQTSDPTDDQRREVAEQEAKIAGLYRQQAEELKSIIREKSSAIRLTEQELALEQAKASAVGITNAEISNIKLPDFSQVVSTALAPLAKIQETIKTITLDLSGSINQAFQDIAIGAGVMLGALLAGDAGVQNFVNVVAGAFADMAITVGKIAISTGMAVDGIQKALKMHPGLAIAAGIALVALGTAVKGSLASAAGGGSAGSAMGTNSYTYDTRTTSVNNQLGLSFPQEIKLVAQGPDLVGVINIENNRKKVTT